MKKLLAIVTLLSLGSMKADFFSDLTKPARDLGNQVGRTIGGVRPAIINMPKHELNAKLKNLKNDLREARRLRDTYSIKQIENKISRVKSLLR